MSFYTRTIRGRARALGLSMNEVYQDTTRVHGHVYKYFRIKVPIEQKAQLEELAKFTRVLLPNNFRVQVYQPRILGMTRDWTIAMSANIPVKGDQSG